MCPELEDALLVVLPIAVIVGILLILLEIWYESSHQPPEEHEKDFWKDWRDWWRK